MNMGIQPPRGRQAGMSLIEMLVALVVLSIGLLGIAALQSKGQQFTQSAYIRTQVTVLAYDIMDKMRANLACADDVMDNAREVTPDMSCSNGYATTTKPGSEPNCETANCSASQLHDYHLFHWYEELGNTLPNGDGRILWDDAENPGMYTIEIFWDERTEEGDATSAKQRWVYNPY